MQTPIQSFNMCMLLVSDQYSEHSRRCCVNTDPNMQCFGQYTLILPVQTVRKYSLKNMFQGLGIWIKFIKPNCLPHNHEGPSKRPGVVAHACIWEAGTAGPWGSLAILAELMSPRPMKTPCLKKQYGWLLRNTTCG